MGYGAVLQRPFAELLNVSRLFALEASFFCGKEQWKRITKGTLFESVPVRIPQTERWTVPSYLSWKFTNDSGEETLVSR